MGFGDGELWHPTSRLEARAPPPEKEVRPAERVPGQVGLFDGGLDGSGTLLNVGLVVTASEWAMLFAVGLFAASRVRWAQGALSKVAKTDHRKPTQTYRQAMRAKQKIAVIALNEAKAHNKSLKHQLRNMQGLLRRAHSRRKNASGLLANLHKESREAAKRAENLAAAHAAELLSQKEELRSTKEEANRLKDQLQQEKQASAKHAARATELSSAHDGLLLKAKQREVQHLEALERSNDLERQASAREAEALSLRNDLRTKNGLLQKASAGFRQEGDAEKQASATPAVVKPEATGTKKPRGMNECEPAAGGEKNDRRTASQGLASKTRRSPPKLIGLTNSTKTNICSLNAVTQLLRHTPQLFEGALERQAKEGVQPPPKANKRKGRGGAIGVKTKSTLTAAMGGIFKDMEGKSDHGKPSSISRSFVSNFFSNTDGLQNGEQADASEVLGEILDKVGEEGLKGQASVIKPAMERLTGETSISTRCGCGRTHKASTPFRLFPLPMKALLKDAPSVKLTDLIAQELADEEGLDPCEDCKGGGGRKSFTKTRSVAVTRCPENFFLHLGRVAYDVKTNRMVKLDYPVDIPLELDMGPFSSEEGASIYDLKGAVHHLAWKGDTAKGHYVAYAHTEKNGWTLFDDQKVTSVKAEEVVSEGAYILAYAKRDNC